MSGDRPIDNIEEWIEAEPLVQAIKPILAGKNPAVQAAVLAELIALFLAGHAPQLRERLLAGHADVVRKLISICEHEIFGPAGHPNTPADKVMTDPKRTFIDALTRKSADEGRLIEAGWIAYRHLVIPIGASQVQNDESRNAFFAGAQHLWASIMSVIDAESNPSDADIRRFSLIDKELTAFVEAMRARAKQ